MRVRIDPEATASPARADDPSAWADRAVEAGESRPQDAILVGED